MSARACCARSLRTSVRVCRPAARVRTQEHTALQEHICLKCEQRHTLLLCLQVCAAELPSHVCNVSRHLQGGPFPNVASRSTPHRLLLAVHFWYAPRRTYSDRSPVLRPRAAPAHCPLSRCRHPPQRTVHGYPLSSAATTSHQPTMPSSASHPAHSDQPHLCCCAATILR